MSRSRPVIAVVVDPRDGDPPGLERLREIATVEVVRRAPELVAAVERADVLAVYDFRTTLVADLGERAGELAWIHAASAGVDAVLTPSVVRSDTVVTNAQGVFDEPIAEWVLAVLLLFAKDLRRSLDLQAHRTWRHRESDRLAGRHVLVVGAGSIGGAIARLLGAAGMQVRGVARTARPDDPDFDAVVATADLHAELARADDVVVAAPLTPATHHLLDAEAFQAMRPGARLVNVGRGPVVDEAALLDALRAGRVGAAALDVFETEPLDPDHPFWTMEQVLVSPHMSGDVDGWVAALGTQFTDNVQRWIADEPLRHVVDKQALTGGGA
ncbi:D-2-hydroxyacid dehydrogenase [Rhabdothermincola salaria]|uniref:D-2-hydroxyacid dehydrogenase n=1 Tax=Rhabdothermincola salaria TaxID=2903142 RepID=UPI001E3B2A46|nr:D-2-hydroxyacid dehydrogenase [Rhabdothermincola salaria]